MIVKRNFYFLEQFVVVVIQPIRKTSEYKQGINLAKPKVKVILGYWLYLNVEIADSIKMVSTITKREESSIMTGRKTKKFCKFSWFCLTSGMSLTITITTITTISWLSINLILTLNK